MVVKRANDPFIRMSQAGPPGEDQGGRAEGLGVGSETGSVEVAMF